MIIEEDSGKKTRQQAELSAGKPESAAHSPEVVQKRDGRLVPFNKRKIANAIFKAAQAAGGEDRERS